MYSLERYRSFYYAALHENFSKAASDLFVSQSSISQAVAKLEEQLGVKLFHRKGRRIYLSAEGRILKEKLQIAFSSIQEAEQTLHSYRHLESGQLNIGASDTICRHFLLPVFSDFHKNVPGIHLSILNQPSPAVLHSLKEGVIDLGFVIATKEEVQKVDATALIPIEEVFFCRRAKDSPTFLRGTEILTKPFVTLGPQSSTRRFLEKIFQELEGSFQPSVEVISIDLMIDLIAIGFGIGFTYRSLLDERFSVIKTDLKVPLRTLWLVKQQHHASQAALKAFEEELLPIIHHLSSLPPKPSLKKE